MKMLEKAARALLKQRQPWQRIPFEDLAHHFQSSLSEEARATIRSIREPDEDVLLAMAIFLMGEQTASVTHARALAKAIWQAGIDAMMEDGK